MGVDHRAGDAVGAEGASRRVVQQGPTGEGDEGLRTVDSQGAESRAETRGEQARSVLSTLLGSTSTTSFTPAGSMAE